jgi:hypothetical protein
MEQLCTQVPFFRLFQIRLPSTLTETLLALAQINIQPLRDGQRNGIAIRIQHQVIGRAREEDVSAIGTDDGQTGIAAASGRRRLRRRLINWRGAAAAPTCSPTNSHQMSAELEKYPSVGRIMSVVK